MRHVSDHRGEPPPQLPPPPPRGHPCARPQPRGLRRRGHTCRHSHGVAAAPGAAYLKRRPPRPHQAPRAAHQLQTHPLTTHHSAEPPMAAVPPPRTPPAGKRGILHTATDPAEAPRPNYTLPHTHPRAHSSYKRGGGNDSYEWLCRFVWPAIATKAAAGLNMWPLERATLTRVDHPAPCRHSRHAPLQPCTRPHGAMLVRRRPCQRAVAPHAGGRSDQASVSPAHSPPPAARRCKMVAALRRRAPGSP